MNDPGMRLYTPEMLALAVRLAEYPLEDSLLLRGTARSPACGSHVEIGLALAPSGLIERIGLRAQACAVGQAACSIFVHAARGLAAPDIRRAEGSIGHWLREGGDLPNWPGMAAIQRAQSFPGRHGAILLPWKAAIDALSKHGNCG